VRPMKDYAILFGRADERPLYVVCSRACAAKLRRELAHSLDARAVPASEVAHETRCYVCEYRIN
jgi:hypothetical protein